MVRKRKLDKGVTTFVDRHGKERARFRLKGMDCAIPHPSSPDYKEVYTQCVAGFPPRKERVAPKTVGDLIARFYASPRFNKAGARWQTTIKQTLEQFRNDARDALVDEVTFEHIEKMLAKRAVKRTEGNRVVGGPQAAARLHEQLVRLFDYAEKKLKWIDANPAREAELPVTLKVAGYHTWTADELDQFQAHHPVGSMARLAMEIAFWTGIRRADVGAFGEDNISKGRATGVAGKTDSDFDMIIAPDLMAAIEATEGRGTDTFLLTSKGKSFTVAGFGNWFRDRCDEAGLPQCSIHGLRKALTTIAANAGATQAELKAMGQWANDSEVATYTKGADQRRLADAAIGRVIKARTSSNQVRKVGQ